MGQVKYLVTATSQTSDRTHHHGGQGRQPHLSRNHFTSRKQKIPRIPPGRFSRYAGFQNHGKAVYLKEVSEESPEATKRCCSVPPPLLRILGSCFCCEAFYLYFWSDDVPDFRGWWFGPQDVAKWNVTPRQSIGRYRHHHPTVFI